MRLFDCTLRDGANVVGNGFDAELTKSIISALLECGIKDIELGNAKGLGAYEALGAKTPLTDREYMKIAAAYANKGNLGMFQMAQLAQEDDIKAAAANGLSFLRVGNTAGEGKNSLAAVHMVKRAGLKCRYSLMKAYVLTPEALAEEAHMLEAEGVDAVTIMDSAGTMFPETVDCYVRKMRKKVSIPIGFHGHSNLGLSQANALIAVDAGAEEIDCGLLGMARSAGNCATELAMATLMREGLLQEMHLYKLLQYLEEELIPAMQKYNYKAAIAPVDMMLGLSGCHSSFLGILKKVAKDTGVSLYELIVAVTKIDQVSPSEELVRNVAATLLQ